MRRPLPGPTASPADLRAAQFRDRVLRTELERVRTAAVSWRNGLGALLVALTGFSLIRGRSNVGELATPWAVSAGALLALAVLAGLCGAILLIRAAHGEPSVVRVAEIRHELLAAHAEALAAASALRRGIALALACAVLLATAVGVTWYGPAKDGPKIRVSTIGAAFCGTIVEVDATRLVVRTKQSTVTLDVRQVKAFTPVEACP
ncbi:hypothetical protein E1264_26045 [Actinomadura sp. KC216]|uniref:hypothetical protein n=1 Tax=Actinomadura sp. KC216 TaxID=2530370 RepID=UPI001052C2CE|nr:hypothetical protein [Actinomadura sp. KC216]TDB84047.1 hypothetical protein E1264_26045 [Actinomadura sp. KC216]